MVMMDRFLKDFGMKLNVRINRDIILKNWDIRFLDL